MMEQPGADLTGILHQISSGDGNRKIASDILYQSVHSELRRIASHLMRRERQNHTLQPTALVHEAYLKLVDQTVTSWNDRAHFFGVAARAMRQILVDHARKHNAGKRGGQWRRVTLDEELADPAELSIEILALHDALDKLAQEDTRMAQVVELRIFGGLLAREVAHVLGVSKRTVDSDWKIARMWLSKALTDQGSA